MHTGQLTASHQEAGGLQCTARMYHQAMDECQRLQSENIALRQMLQYAVEEGSGVRARGSSRGRNQTRQRAESVRTVLKPHMSFVAERETAQGSCKRSCSPILSRYGPAALSVRVSREVCQLARGSLRW